MPTTWHVICLRSRRARVASQLPCQHSGTVVALPAVAYYHISVVSEEPYTKIAGKTLHTATSVPLASLRNRYVSAEKTSLACVVLIRQIVKSRERRNMLTLRKHTKTALNGRNCGFNASVGRFDAMCQPSAPRSLNRHAGAFNAVFVAVTDRVLQLRAAAQVSYPTAYPTVSLNYAKC